MDLGELIPIVSVVAVFSIPITIILTSHQRKMAELIHGNVNRDQSQDVQRLDTEMREIRQLVHQQAITLDDLRKKMDALSAGSDEVRERLRNS